MMPGSENVDFAHSKVIPSNFGLRMWVNDRYRFAQGVVPIADKEAVLAELSAFLKEDRDQATGEPIIANTYLGADLYHGPYAHRGPDLVIEYNNLFRPGSTPTVRNAHLEGGHTLEGILMAHGPDIQPREVSGASLIDLAPTVLYLLDRPIPADMDGRVLTEIVSASCLAEKPVRHTEEPARWDTQLSQLSSPAYTAAEEAEIEDQLRQLGYIE
jgi:predicted AlkP superfamily phosphohydrolase/phosphomutase